MSKIPILYLLYKWAKTSWSYSNYFYANAPKETSLLTLIVRSETPSRNLKFLATMQLVTDILDGCSNQPYYPQTID